LREKVHARAHVQVGVGTEGEGERESQADSLLSAEPGSGLPSHDPEIMTGAEITSQMLN